MNEVFVNTKDKSKWLVDGYYIDQKGQAYTLLINVKNWKKVKKVKGVL